MNRQPLPQAVPEAWTTRWKAAAREQDLWPLPQLLLDDTDTWPAAPRRAQIERTNRARAEALRKLVLPALVRHVYPAYRIEAGPPKLPDLVVDAGGDPPESRVATFTQPRGRIFLRDLCPPSLIERLRPDPGLAAFTRRPDREHALLMHVAMTSHGSVSLAHTESGIIVGQVVLSPAEEWWRELPGVYELSIETSRNWRGIGIGHRLLEFCFQPDWIERVTVLAMGLDWHWDLDGAGLEVNGYANMLRLLFEKAGFRRVHTSEPNVAMHTTNLLLVRVGSKVPPELKAALDEALFIAPWQRTTTAGRS